MTNLERMEQIELPAELEQVIIRAVDLGRKRKKQMIWKRVGLGCMGAAAGFAILVCAGFISPMAAQAFEGVPAVGKVFTYLYDLAGYEGRYEHVAEKANPVEPMGQKESLQGGMAGPQVSLGQQVMTDRQGAADRQGTSGKQNTETAQYTAAASDAGITITVKEYFCDKKSLYLSMEIESEAPFFESSVEENTKGYIQLFTGDEVLSYEGTDPFSLGNSSLTGEGVFLDGHTFLGIVRSEWCSVREEDLAVPDELTYAVSIKHLRIYSENDNPEIRGDWDLSMGILCEKEAIEILPVGAAGEDGSSICEVRLQPFEVQVVTQSDNGAATLTEEYKMLVAFDGEGNLLDSAGSTLSYREGDKEIYEYVRPEHLNGLELFIVDENSWMNQWKGGLYDGTTTGPEMVEFLKENCITYALVNCKE